MNDQSLEFQNIKDDLSLPKIVRKSFRIPVQDKQDVWLEFDSEKYNLMDIGEDGIRIALTTQSQFQPRQKLNHCKLYIDGEFIENLNGQIVHFSSDLENGWQYGIQWIDPEKKSHEKILNILKKMKAELLDGD